MLTLALDAATKMCTAALLKDGKVLAEYNVNMGHTHSEGLLPMLDQLFARAGIGREEIDRIAVGIGPGSFTGLRIGLATAEALAYAWRCNICGVLELPALCYNLQVENVLLAPLLDAQKGNYYMALYAWEENRLTEKIPCGIFSKEKIVQRLGEECVQVLLLGECEKFAREALPTNVKLAPDYYRLPRAGAIGLAADDPQCVFGTCLDEMKPFYFRRSEAEELWEMRHSQTQTKDAERDGKNAGACKL